MSLMTKTINKYSYPVVADSVSSIVEDTSSGSHGGAYKGSVDFAVPLDTIVYAVANGVVRRVRDDSDKHGKTSSYGSDVNYITIEHDNNELSEYLHLAKDSALVKVGETVETGQPIAKTGLSGWLFAPHLHFMVYNKVAKPADFQCLEIKFH